MKHIQIILGLVLFASVSTFAQSPRIKLNQITKDTVKGSVLISSASDSGMVYSRDFYIAYGLTDTVLILYGDTISGGGGLSSVLSDGVTITGNGTSGNELKVDTSLISTIQGLVDTLTNRGYLSVTQLTDTLDANTRGFLTSEVDGSISNELQTISTSGAAGNITLSDGGGTLNLNVDDADASVSNEGSLTVGAGTASTSVISSNTSGSTDVTLTAGSNITLSEAGNNITIAASGGGASYNNISETADTVYISDYLDVDTSTLYVDASNNRVGIGTIPNSEAGQNVNWRYTFDALTPSSANVVQGSRIYGENNYYIRHDIKNTITGSTNLGGAGISLITEGTQADFTSFSVNSTDSTRAGRTMLATSSANSAGILFRTTGNHDIEFTAYSDGSTTPDMVISGSNVGIGTSSPSGTLEVNKNVNDNNWIKAINTNIGTSARTGFVMGNGGTSADEVYFQLLGQNFNFLGAGFNDKFFVSAGSKISNGIEFFANSGGIRLNASVFGADDFFIEDATGHIGVNNLSPNVELDVIGSIEYTGTITDVSDERLKINKEPLFNITSQLMRLNPIKYNQLVLEDNTLGVPEYGLTAQNVREVFPEMVTTVHQKDGVDYLGLSYIQLISPLIKGFQEQQAIIETQEQKITDLENTIQSLITRIENLENK